MHPDRSHAHYMPTSVGLLMEPALLRRAAEDMAKVNQADDAAPMISPAVTSLWPKCLVLLAVRLVAKFKATH